MNDWDEYNAEKRRQKAENYNKSMAIFEEAQKLAAANGFELARRSSPWHFTLTYKIRAYTKWLYNIYPSNQRIYVDPNFKGPFLKLTKPWTLLEVVNAAISQVKDAIPCS